MKKFKKVLALALAMTLVVGSSMTAFAAESTPGQSTTVEGTGTVEGSVNTDVWNVVLPETVSGDNTYDFILDPEGLIAETDAVKYSGADFEEDANLFFQVVSGSGVAYSATSDAKKIVNKSSYAVDVTVSATVTAGTGVAINPDATFANDTTASIYMAVEDSASHLAAVAANGTVSVVSTMAAAKDGSYEVVYDTESASYTYELVDSPAADAFAEYSFQLTGACNSAADWSDLTEVEPTVQVVYKVDKAATSAAPSVSDVTYSGSGDLVIPYSLGSGTLAASALTDFSVVYNSKVFSKNGVNSSNTAQAANFTLGESSVTVSETLAKMLQGATGTTCEVSLYFDDSTTPVTATVTFPE